MAKARKVLTVESVLRTLARVEALKTLGGDEDVAAALVPQVAGMRIQGLGELLDTVASYMKKIQTEHQYDPWPKCIECGEDIQYDLTVHEKHRKDVRYCSGRCRQRAYRKRVTENNSHGAADASQNA